MSEAEPAPAGIDTTVMSHARAYDYVLGGKDNSAVDREAAKQVMALAPDLPVLGQALEEISVNSPSPRCFRPRAEILRFFDGFELLEPGLTDVQDWWLDETAPETKLRVAAGVGKL